MLRTRRLRQLLEITRRPARPAAPAVFGLLVSMVVVQFAGLLLAVPGISLGSLLALSADGLAGWEVWRMPGFVLSCFAPAAVTDPGFVPALLASFLLFALSTAAIFLSGATAEARVGTRGLLAMIGFAALLHGIVSLLVFGQTGAFGPTAITAAIMTVGSLARIEQGPRSGALQADARITVSAFLVLAVLVSAAFDQAFLPPLVGLFAGVLAGFAAFHTIRSLELSLLTSQGTASVGGMLYADDAELLTVEELRSAADKLLEKISSDGYDSLDTHQRSFLARASARLRQMDDGE